MRPKDVCILTTASASPRDRLEHWGANAGPWLQGLHFCFGVGAIFSSLILGVFGLGVAFATFAAVGASSACLPAFLHALWHRVPSFPR